MDELQSLKHSGPLEHPSLKTNGGILKSLVSKLISDRNLVALHSLRKIEFIHQDTVDELISVPLDISHHTSSYIGVPTISTDARFYPSTVLDYHGNDSWAAIDKT